MKRRGMTSVCLSLILAIATRYLKTVVGPCSLAPGKDLKIDMPIIQPRVDSVEEEYCCARAEPAGGCRRGEVDIDQ